MMDGRRHASGGRYDPSSGFGYNATVAAALVPALVVALGFTHELVAGACVVGALVVSILDLSGECDRCAHPRRFLIGMRSAARNRTL